VHQWRGAGYAREAAEMQTDVSMRSARDASQGISLSDRIESNGVANVAVQVGELEPMRSSVETQTATSMQDASQGMSLDDRMEFGGVASAAVQAVIEQADVAAECRPETEDATEQCTPCAINVASQCTPARNTVDIAQGMSLSDRIDSGGVADMGAQSVILQADAAVQCVPKPAIKSPYRHSEEADVPVERKREIEDAAKQRTPRAIKAALEHTPEHSKVNTFQGMSLSSCFDSAGSANVSFVVNQSVISKQETSLKRLMEAKPRYRNPQISPTKDFDDNFDT